MTVLVDLQTSTPGIINNNDVLQSTAINNVTDADNNPSINVDTMKKQKKSASFNFFRTALVVLRNDKEKKSAPKVDQVASNGNWKKIVGSMRPLHLQDNQSPPPTPQPASPQRTDEGLMEDILIIQQPSSPSPSCVSGDTMSQYTSASNLQELDDSSSSDEEGDPDEVFDVICGDEKIDAKAEEFIARFYKQMKLQHVAMNRPSHHHHHHH